RNELRRLGNNLNQIAYRMNATGQHAPPILDDLLRGINQTLMEALEDIKEDREP
nr:MobC family plasmid mobilization relaxosome protein [Bacteroidota bacterium]